jgi:DNA-binding transcriptional LysR family regulator
MNENDVAGRMRTRLKTRHMLLLVTLDETRNLHQAAEAATMTQPGVSKMLKDIEDILGVPLFERLPRGVRPTVYGETMIRHVRMALAHLAHGQQSIATLRAGLSGHVNIGVIVAPALTLIPRAIARAKEEAPNLCIGVEVSTSNDLVVKLKQEHLDFLIARILEREDEPSLLYEDMTEEVVCVVGRRAHPLVAHPKLTLKELAQAKWILSARGSILRNRFDMMFRRADLDMPANVVETTAMSVTMSLLQQTDFLHVMPVEVARYYVATGELAILPIDIPCRMERFGIITSRDQVLSEGANLLLRHIRAVAAEIY